MSHDRACTLVGAALAFAFAAGVLASGHVVRAGARAGTAVADWLTGRIPIGRVL